jgi:hypothetical protein
MKTRKILVAMSHQLQEKQTLALNVLGFQVITSEIYISEKCNMLSPNLTSEDLEIISQKIIKEAELKGCSGIIMVGEPMLTFHVWDIARASGLEILQSTTERKTVEETQKDGSIIKTQMFDHVQWRRL